MVNCPEIAKPQVLVTASNSDFLVLDTYERTPGTTVKVSCLVPTGFKVNGSTTLHCNETGVWSDDIPKCILKTPTNTGGNGNNGGSSHEMYVNSDLTMVPWIVTFALFALLLMLVIICFVYALYRKRRKERMESKKTHQYDQDPGTLFSYMDRWNSKQSLASPYRSYERPEDSLTDSSRYVTLQDQWDTVTVIS